MSIHSPVSYLRKNTLLQAEDFDALLEDRAQIVVVSNFVNKQVRETLLDFARRTPNINYTNDILDATGVTKYENYGVWRIGPALNALFGVTDVAEREQLLESYFLETERTRNAIEQALGSLTSPVTKLQRVLNNVHPGGARLATIDERPCMTGILRGTEPGITPMVEQPHIDLIRDESLETFHHIRKQFSALMILSNPKVGGELRVWQGRLFDPAQGEKERDFIDRITNEQPYTQVQPKAGDLILFNTRHPHATTLFEGNSTDRVSMQTFVGYQGPRKPLLLWN